MFLKFKTSDTYLCLRKWFIRIRQAPGLAELKQDLTWGCVTNSIEKAYLQKIQRNSCKYDPECKKDNTTLNRNSFEHFDLVFTLKKSYLANKLTSTFETLSYLRILSLQTCFFQFLKLENKSMFKISYVSPLPQSKWLPYLPPLASFSLCITFLSTWPILSPRQPLICFLYTIVFIS